MRLHTDRLQTLALESNQNESAWPFAAMRIALDWKSGMNSPLASM
jgi:hypothetical protein